MLLMPNKKIITIILKERSRVKELKVIKLKRRTLIIKINI